MAHRWATLYFNEKSIRNMEAVFPLEFSRTGYVEILIGSGHRKNDGTDQITQGRGEGVRTATKTGFVLA